MSVVTSALTSSYARNQGSSVDELIDQHGVLRPHWTQIAESLDEFGPNELQRRSAEIRRLLEQDGVTYNVTTGGRRRHQPWNLDALPLVLPSTEWLTIEQGIVQRAQLLDLILQDLYGERRLLRDGLIPPSIVLGDPQFLRECDGIRLPGQHQLVMSATDLVRTSDRGWVALGQRTQAPSGAAYAMENRRVLARVFPAMFHSSRVQRVAPFVPALGQALRAAAPPGIENPGIVILSPGPMSETAFEHASLAAQLGYPLVEGGDLHVRDGQVWLREVGGLRRIHVILRRVDAWFADPLELRPDSTLGVAGLVDACRVGAVSVANTLGSGVLENAALQALLPGLCQHMLGEELQICPAQAWWCGDDAQRSHVFANLGQLVIRPASRQGLGSSIDTSRSTRAELDALRKRIQSRPAQWVGQELLEPATAPLVSANGFERRPTVLRTFAVAHGDGVYAMPGGLARAASSRSGTIAAGAGAIAKDVWITGDVGSEHQHSFTVDATPILAAGPTAPAARAAEHLFWLGRYAERAEATVRLLRVVSERRDEFGHVPGGPGFAALTALFETVTRTTGTFPGFVGDDAARMRIAPDAELFALLTNGERVGTVAHAIVHMFDAIDVLRDQLSVDTWLVVGSLQRELEELATEDEAASDDITRVLNDLVEGLLALAGVGNESTVRDPAWHFMECGRRIERALQISTLLTTTLSTERGAAAESLLLESVMTASESIITYRRRYRAQPRLPGVLELLIHDQNNPRSISYQIHALQSSVRELVPDQSAPAESGMQRVVDQIQELLTQADTHMLAAANRGGSRGALDELGAALQAGLRELSDLISTEYFQRILPQRSMAQ